MMNVQVVRALAKAVVPARFRPALRRAYDRLRHFGTSCYCPVCRSHLRGFLPHASCDGSVRPNAECPVCGCCERHRLFWTFVEGFRIFCGQPKTVLHIGPELPLRRRFSQQPGIRYVAGDISPRPGDRRLDLTALDIASDSIDFVYAGYVLMMIADETAAIRESYRVLRPGGMAVLQLPIYRDVSIDYRGSDSQECLRLFSDPNMHHVFGVDVFDRFRAAGFEVVVVPYSTLMSAAVKQRHGFEPQDIIVCLKPGTT
jgi:hypothetical protein